MFACQHVGILCIDACSHVITRVGMCASTLHSITLSCTTCHCWHYLALKALPYIALHHMILFRLICMALHCIPLSWWKPLARASNSVFRRSRWGSLGYGLLGSKEGHKAWMFLKTQDQLLDSFKGKPKGNHLGSPILRNARKGIHRNGRP